MKLTFTKGAGKYDRLEIIAADGPRPGIDCPKQGIIPHDMVHFAVEAEVTTPGFLGLIAAGGDGGFRLGLDDAQAQSVERLVEMFQGEGWSGGPMADADFIALYQVTCEERGDTPLPISGATIAAIRARIADLTAQWAAVPVGGKLVLTL
ncbi:hypothetical protein CHU93_03775 [Sandarakinorhabdus cyanobacteriorum]|uniref:Uncharacterized protein n=1 Tax=Sandarakinorhabdus cyanobacteriorum TaxID=1981098 RepID=A0A255YS60_9SPHN|nr:hypothetical protein [Sandarakinorhabdus cyanobacteriorum]OYQ32029.1 hypothetical protein CHU93_03775 [Sandarakinorhabdus cyanobacteriorum]